MVFQTNKYPCHLIFIFIFICFSSLRILLSVVLQFLALMKKKPNTVQKVNAGLRSIELVPQTQSFMGCGIPLGVYLEFCPRFCWVCISNTAQDYAGLEREICICERNIHVCMYVVSFVYFATRLATHFIFNFEKMKKL